MITYLCTHCVYLCVYICVCLPYTCVFTSLWIWFYVLLSSWPAPGWRWGSAPSWLWVTWCPAVAPPSSPSSPSTYWSSWPKARPLQWPGRTFSASQPSVARVAIESVKRENVTCEMWSDNGNMTWWEKRRRVRWEEVKEEIWWEWRRGDEREMKLWEEVMR